MTRFHPNKNVKPFHRFKTRFHSTGETFIRNQLIRNHIQFKEQTPIRLKGDKKKIRIADFYLPKKKLYVEFLGKWNNLRQQYINKINV